MVNTETKTIKAASKFLQKIFFTDNDATERLVLTWIKNKDKASGLNFGKYIDVNK